MRLAKRVDVLGENNMNWIDSMNSLTTLIIVGLVVALCVVGYLYYQRTSSDITIQLPKVSMMKSSVPAQPAR